MLRQSARVCCLSVRLVSKITPRTLIESETGIIEAGMVGSVTTGKLRVRWQDPNNKDYDLLPLRERPLWQNQSRRDDNASSMYVWCKCVKYPARYRANNVSRCTHQCIDTCNHGRRGQKQYACPHYTVFHKKLYPLLFRYIFSFTKTNFMKILMSTQEVLVIMGIK